MTAVEFLSEQLLNLEIQFDCLSISRENYWSRRNNILKKAKEMEKQQIENAFDDGWNRANETKQQAYTTLEDIGSNYYNKTFKNK